MANHPFMQSVQPLPKSVNGHLQALILGSSPWELRGQLPNSGMYYKRPQKKTFHGEFPSHHHACCFVRTAANSSTANIGPVYVNVNVTNYVYGCMLVGVVGWRSRAAKHDACL